MTLGTDMSRTSRFGAAILAATLAAPVAEARSPETDAKSGMDAFARHCFSPFLSGDAAAEAFNLPNLRHDFYDLDPLTRVAPTEAKTSATPGTDRRCEVSFDGDYAEQAMAAVVEALRRERILLEVPLPETHAEARLPGTALLAARQLNPRRTAVVHVGTRPGPDGVETFLNVERLQPQE